MLYQLSYTHHGPANGRAPSLVRCRGVDVRVLGGRLIGRAGAEPSRDLARLFATRTGLRHKDRLPVIAQLLNAFSDVGESAVAAVLLGRREVGAGIPAASQLLDRRHIDHPVMQPV